jgi:hypothetical protein
LIRQIFIDKIANRIIIRILPLILLGITCSSSYAQSTPVADTSHVVRKNDKSVNDTRQHNREKKGKKDRLPSARPDDQPDNNSASGSSDPVKRINSARPDMSRMRGARPPDILRPSGPLLPRGIGKPGGAVRPGGH